jgi:hypothetical protein
VGAAFRALRGPPVVGRPPPPGRRLPDKKLKLVELFYIHKINEIPIKSNSNTNLYRLLVVHASRQGLLRLPIASFVVFVVGQESQKSQLEYSLDDHLAGPHCTV